MAKHSKKRGEDFLTRFKKYLEISFEIAKLNKKKVSEAAKDSEATLWGLLFTAVAGLATSIGTVSVDNAIVLAAGYIVWTVMFTLVLFIVSKLFGSKASYVQIFRPRALSSVTYWVGAVPGIGPSLLWIAEIWLVVVSIVIVKRVCKLGLWQSVVVVLIPVIAVVVMLAFLIAAITASIVAGLV